MPQSHWDQLIITASSAAQARGYRLHMRMKERLGLLHGVGRWAVVADPGGRRVGSGGSTLLAIAAAADKSGPKRVGPPPSWAKRLESTTTLILHSGGDSRRLPAFAALGKLFTPLPDEVDGRRVDLFDLILKDFADLNVGEVGRVVVAAGDLLVDLHQHRPDMSARGTVGLAFPDTPERGSRHGVYVLDAGGRVARFLQKPTRREATAGGAMLPDGRVLVDTGVVSFDLNAIERWQRAGTTPFAGSTNTWLALLKEKRAPSIDLYAEVMMMLAGHQVVPQPPRSHHDLIAGCLKHAFKGAPFRAAVVPDCKFRHVGTTREFIDDVLSARRPMGVDGLVSINSVVSSARATSRRDRLVVESSQLSRVPHALGGLIVGVPAEIERTWPERGLRLPPCVGLSCLPIGKSEWTIVLFGDRDDFKTPVATDGGERGAILLNRPLSNLMRRCGSTGLSWSSDERSAFSARFWPVMPANSVWQAVKWMLDLRSHPNAAWRHAKRLSLAEVVRTVNHERLLQHRHNVQRIERLERSAERFEAARAITANDLARDVTTSRERIVLVESLTKDTHGVPDAERLRAAALLTPRSKESKRLETAALAAVARRVEQASKPLKSTAEAARAVLRHDQVVWVTCPVRIDLAGGWTDTPPICQDMGGVVVNTAITLNGQYPVQVVARLTKDPILRVSSIDLGRSCLFTNAAQVRRHSDPTDWAAVAKAALVLCGIVPDKRPLSQISLRGALERFGGGIDVTMFAALPKGSGLGTSSILGGALIAALHTLRGAHLSTSDLIHEVSRLEQRMSTAGGWQDQAGGIAPGMKVLRTWPGESQVPAIDPLNADPLLKASEGRLLLYFTGRQRLARNILQSVVLRYLARDHPMREALRRLKERALCMADSIRTCDLDGFADGLRTYWDLKRTMDAGATNPFIESMIEPLRPHLRAHVLPGAGGGGFLFMVAKSAKAARRIRKTLSESPPHPSARFFDFEVDRRGLGISTL